eukprot:UN17062
MDNMIDNQRCGVNGHPGYDCSEVEVICLREEFIFGTKTMTCSEIECNPLEAPVLEGTSVNCDNAIKTWRCAVLSLIRLYIVKQP